MQKKWDKKKEEAAELIEELNARATTSENIKSRTDEQIDAGNDEVIRGAVERMDVPEAMPKRGDKEGV